MLILSNLIFHRDKNVNYYRGCRNKKKKYKEACLLTACFYGEIFKNLKLKKPRLSRYRAVSSYPNEFTIIITVPVFNQ